MPQDRRPVGVAAAVFVVVAAVLAVRGCGHDAPSPAPDRRGADAPRKPSVPSVRRGPAPSATEVVVPPSAPAPDTTPPVAPKATKLLRVRVLDSSGVPAAGAAVVVTDHFARDDESKLVPLAEAVADADGRVEFRLPKTNYVVHAVARREAAVLGNVGNFLGVGDTPSRDIELRLGPLASVRGVVRTTGGTPVADAKVTGFFERAGLSRWTFVSRATTGTDGRFVFEALPRAEYGRPATIRVERGVRHWNSEIQATVAETDARELTLVVEPTRQLRGRCVDALRVPIAMPWLHFAGGGRRLGDDGRFDCQIRCGAGKLRLNLDSAETGGTVIEISAGADDVDLGDVVLDPAPPK